MRLPTTPTSCLLLLAGVLVIASASPGLAQEETDSPLVERAKSLFQGMDQIETEEERIERRALLRAMADTLENAQ